MNAYEVYKHNRTQIIKIWRVHEFIRQESDFSMVKYAKETYERYKEMIKNGYLTYDYRIESIQADLYKHL